MSCLPGTFAHTKYQCLQTYTFSLIPISFSISIFINFKWRRLSTLTTFDAQEIHEMFNKPNRRPKEVWSPWTPTSKSMCLHPSKKGKEKKSQYAWIKNALPSKLPPVSCTKTKHMQQNKFHFLRVRIMLHNA